MIVLRTISNLLLATLILFTSSGLSIHKHHCMGSVRDVAINHHADSCTGDMDMETRTGCCSNSLEYFEADDYQVSNQHFDLGSDEISGLFYNKRVPDLVATYVVNQDYYNYKPPLIQRDLPVLTQSFLL